MLKKTSIIPYKNSKIPLKPIAVLCHNHRRKTSIY
ncbi:hypothetical protein SAMN06272722_111160 [Paenibacillus sp. RU5A]|nr:hypothetical protein SAMN06272722_111160 [Paenibacillus sp. RU5A]SOC74896.1 hypothetical protein SAMN05880581_111160 [Paenibacillus sp. RU26A]SOC77015.1 hypothetical protein SAMN05880586_111160 [Paenibacillus sp. RU5M]